MPTIVVVEYDPAWPAIFEQLRSHIWPVVKDIAITIEHIGSTSVPGLAAKPIIDMSVVLPSEREVSIAVERLAALGYEHLGDLGVEGREAFRRPVTSPAHNLYVCPQNSLGLQNHLAVRDYLRSHPETARAYGELKKRLAREFPHDMHRYVAGKTDLVLEMLRAQGLTAQQIEAIARANRQK